MHLSRFVFYWAHNLHIPFIWPNIRMLVPDYRPIKTPPTYASSLNSVYLVKKWIVTPAKYFSVPRMHPKRYEDRWVTIWFYGSMVVLSLPAFGPIPRANPIGIVRRLSSTLSSVSLYFAVSRKVLLPRRIFPWFRLRIFDLDVTLFSRAFSEKCGLKYYNVEYLGHF